MRDNNLLPALPDSLTADYERERARTYYTQLQLEQWSRRPIRRRTAQEQAARTTWRMLRTFLAAVFSMLTLVGLASTLINAETWSATGLCGMLTVAILLISPEAPAWFIRLHKEVG